LLLGDSKRGLPVANECRDEKSGIKVSEKIKIFRRKRI
jgi:hypothetical protein